MTYATSGNSDQAELVTNKMYGLYTLVRLWLHYLGLDWSILIVLGFNDTSTLEGHFVSSPREREKRDRRESRGDEREGQGRKRNRNESEETEEIKTFPSTLTHYKDSRPCPTVSQYQLDAPVMKATQHLCTTRPPPDWSITMFTCYKVNKYLQRLKFLEQVFFSPIC